MRSARCEFLGHEERELERLHVVQARVAQRLVPRLERRLVDVLGAAQALGDIVAGELDVDAARVRPGGAVRLEEALDLVDHIVEAEQLGYERAWLFDSPALYGDIWVTAALAAQRTTRIGLGPAVIVPNLRHPLTQASAIATIAQLAPGRVAVAIGTGFTGRMAMGKKALTWK